MLDDKESYKALVVLGEDVKHIKSDFDDLKQYTLNEIRTMRSKVIDLNGKISAIIERKKAFSWVYRAFQTLFVTSILGIAVILWEMIKNK